MTPKEKVKLTLQVILIITFVSLCVLSFSNLLKADTSLAFRKENAGFYPWFTICPLSYELIPINSFENISTASLRDYLHIDIVKLDRTKQITEAVTAMKNVEEYFGTKEILSQKIIPRIYNGSILITNCTTFKTSFKMNSLSAGTYDNYINFLLDSNEHFKDFQITFHDESENPFGLSKDGNVLYVNFRANQRK